VWKTGNLGLGLRGEVSKLPPPLTTLGKEVIELLG